MRNEKHERFQAVMEALDMASGGETPRHWSTWRAVIAEGICAAVEWTPPPPPPPRCPGCSAPVDGTEQTEVWRAPMLGDKPRIASTWTCCGHVRSYLGFAAFGYRYEDADSYEQPSEPL